MTPKSAASDLGVLVGAVLPAVVVLVDRLPGPLGEPGARAGDELQARRRGGHAPRRRRVASVRDLDCLLLKIGFTTQGVGWVFF